MRFTVAICKPHFIYVARVNKIYGLTDLLNVLAQTNAVINAHALFEGNKNFPTLESFVERMACIYLF